MCDFVRQNAGEDAVERAFDVHILAENAAAIEGERRGPRRCRSW